jgi:hypothetical protein
MMLAKAVQHGEFVNAFVFYIHFTFVENEGGQMTSSCKLRKLAAGNRMRSDYLSLAITVINRNARLFL